MRIKVLLFGLFLIFTTEVHANDLTPFCTNLCTCKIDDGKVILQCLTDIRSQLFEPENWINADKNNTLYDITDLIIRNNELVSLQTKFPNSTLKLLDLANNNIRNITDSVFQNLQQMEVLLLNNNNIEILHPSAFNGQYLEGALYPLKSLRELRLDQNLIKTLDQDIFEHTTRVEILNLSYNALNIIDHDTAVAITSLQKLKLLDLSYTGISKFPASFLYTPKQLTTLYISGNAFETIPKGLKEASSLETLVIDNNPFVNLTEHNGFPVIKTLKVLHMCNMPKLVYIGGGSLSNLTNLEELHLANNILLSNLNDSALSHRKDHESPTEYPPIRKFHIDNNKLSTINMGLLGRWSVLAELELDGNPWSCDCENQWMVTELYPIYATINAENEKELKCGAPIEMVDFTFKMLHDKNEDMRCLDLYGARPEKDSILLVGMLAGVLIGIPVILSITYAYKRNWFGLFDKSPAAYSRQFYGHTDGNSVYEY